MLARNDKMLARTKVFYPNAGHRAAFSLSVEKLRAVGLAEQAASASRLCGQRYSS